MIKTERLRHGGIIANYECTAACRHCLFASSPKRCGGYVGDEAALSICAALIKGGCRSVHIGGGEPFINPDGLARLVRIAIKSGISVEYVETNAFWAESAQARDTIKKVLNAGVNTLCISVDPFHAEYVPYGRPLKLAELCESEGMDYFLWRAEFLPGLRKLDPARTHGRREMERRISDGYLRKTAQAYGIAYKGRALNIEMENLQRRPVESIISGRPCSRLMSGDHFHVDLFKRYIPPGCTGIAVPLDDAISGLPEGKYPVMERLLDGGASYLLEYAEGLGFRPEPSGYTSNCALCFFIRKWLADASPTPDLDVEYYGAAMDYYVDTNGGE